MARESTLALFFTLNLTFLCLVVSALHIPLLDGHLTILPRLVPDHKHEPTPVIHKPTTEPTPNYNNYKTNPTPYLTPSPPPPPPPPQCPPPPSASPPPPSPSPPPPSPPPIRPICPLTECVNVRDNDFSTCCSALQNMSSVSTAADISACLCDITKELWVKFPDWAPTFEELSHNVFHKLSYECKVITGEMATQESIKCLPPPSPLPPPPPPYPSPPPPSPSPPPPPPASSICPIKTSTECVNRDFDTCCPPLHNVSIATDFETEIMSACLCDITKGVFANQGPSRNVDEFDKIASQIFDEFSKQCEVEAQDSTVCQQL